MGKRIWVGLIMMLGILLAVSPYVEACGRIMIERPPRPDVSVTNIAVQNATLDIKITDQVATVTVDEVFHNPNNWQLEGTFILPMLPETSVTNLSLWMNGQETKGELLDRDKALQYYEDIVRRQYDPALLEYAGNGLLKLRVFPIPPAEQDLGVGKGNVRIKYTYTYRLSNDNGLCTFRHPWGTNKFSSAPLDQAVIKVNLKSKVPLKTIYSPTYPAIDVKRTDDHNAVIGFEQNKMKPDKDFILYYTLSDQQFGVNLVSYKKNGADGYFMMMLAPKYSGSDNDVVKKDVVFVLDTSGSMLDNDKIGQARSALEFCVKALREDDRFNIITFATDVRPFKKSLQEVTPATREEALKWIKDIEARGGTNIDEALQTALGMVDSASKRPFMVVFMTDGIPTMGEQVPEKILAKVSDKNTTNVRIFTFGVGHDVNTHLLDKLAEANHGAREYIAPDENIEAKVSNFYTKIAYPALSDVKLEVSGVEVYDRYPRRLPDLFRGSQLVLYGRYKGEGTKSIALSGLVNGEARKFAYEIPSVADDSADFIPRLWATSKIGYLMDEIRLRGENEEVKKEIIALAKEHGILTKYTSWLVLEDVSRQPRPNSPAWDGFRGKMGGGRFEEELRKEDKAMKVPAPSGEKAVQQSQEAQRLQQGDFGLGNDMADREMRDVVREQVQQVADKTFYQGSDGIWYDSLYKDIDKDKISKVEFGSEEYFNLLKKHPRLGKYLAVGQEVVVQVGEKIYQITQQKDKPEKK